ncbi:hypothetical protein OH76DRAFT_505466 [Lentinus brumalis]|uniref:Uncharacterized protein n=1 Tax=Lentinus brumalis TaxID=2498619 RepID=A0A371CHX9_9APHY|nr:hypothetical protein OH76DRAFT_505466 [Polyporus brumalis]
MLAFNVQLEEVPPVLPGVLDMARHLDASIYASQQPTTLRMTHKVCLRSRNSLHQSTELIWSTLSRLVSSLRRCHLLESLDLYFTTMLVPPEADIRMFCNPELALNSVILLAPPPTLRMVRITFVDAENCESDTFESLAGLSNWGRLDDALCRLEHAEVVCMMAQDCGVVLDNSARTGLLALASEIICGDSDERMPLLRRCCQ